MNGDAQWLCDSYQGTDRNILFSTFNITDVGRVKVCLFRQLFLAQLSVLPGDANVFAKNLLIFQDRRHSLIPKQATRRATIGYMPILYLHRVSENW